MKTPEQWSTEFGKSVWIPIEFVRRIQADVIGDIKPLVKMTEELAICLDSYPNQASLDFAKRHSQKALAHATKLITAHDDSQAKNAG